MADAEDNTVILTFKYRLLPNKKQHKSLAALLETQRQLYNGCLEHRITSYQRQNKNITLYAQMAELTQLRKEPEYAAVPANLQRWTLRKLDLAYQAFFRRVKAKGEKAGFPRFRGKGRWQSFGFSGWDGIRLKGKRLHFKGMTGGLRMHLHRLLPEGKPLCCTFTKDHKGWYVCLQYRVPCAHRVETGRATGIDFGLTHLATLADGTTIPNAKIAKRAERGMRQAQRALSRCKRGSNRRRKVKSQLSKLHCHIANTRSTYMHQVSARLVRDYDFIAIEKLNIKGLAGGMLARSVNDAAWGILGDFLRYKAAYAGSRTKDEDCRNTTKECSGCGEMVPKTLSQRRHDCPHCGLSLDRDHNAALNILHRAVMRPEPPNVAQWGKRAAGNIIVSARAK